MRFVTHRILVIVSIILFFACSEKEVKMYQSTEESLPSVSREFVNNLEYLGVVLDRPDYYTWGTSVVQGEDGKFHMFACQWNTKHGFSAWSVESEVNYFKADKPEGPYQFVKTILSARPGGNKEGEWNQYTAHNPEVKIIDGKYVLTYISYPEKGAISDGKIGMKIAKNPEGSWQDVGMIMQKSSEPGYPSYKSLRGTDNNSLIKYHDKYYLFFMYNPRNVPMKKNIGSNHDNTSLGVAVANNLEGPYIEQVGSAFASPAGKKVEDLCAFVNADGIVSATMCDNFGMYSADGGIYMEMDLGHFERTGEVLMVPKSIAWETRPKLFPNQDFSKGKTVYGANKFERPKIIKVDGVPSYMFLPSGFNAKGNPWTVLHGFKIHKKKQK
ncbi:glycoside hydrolase family protein [Polaribacter haliotis]|uniref:Glycoside hydrolase family protein n=1 Tax=Polaribacter haliotis TaxID=1888915 RepID=A0A7L8AEM0_9FLAO|nr:glycoside hydrolase family protein [Polaribacter haliotis]QOD60432.1 glycoside hydrolase family protein [Polaribacter haliotis]